MIQAPDQNQISQLLPAITDKFKVFVEEVIGLDNAPFHDEIDDIISNPLYKKIVIAIARGHGKSTHLSVAYPLWALAKDHNLKILIVSSTATIASGFVTQIINHLEGNDKYLDWARWVDPEHIGVLPKKRVIQKKEEKWAGNAITIERHDLNAKEPSIQALGLFGSILSKRADIIIIDDLVNQQNSETQEQREKIIDWVDTTLRPILVPGGRMIYLGNTWHQDDLVARLLQNPQWDYRSRMPAIEQESAHRELWDEWANIYLDDEMGPEEKMNKGNAYFTENQDAMMDSVKVLWPERHSPDMPCKYAELYLERLNNPYSFARMYQCDPSLRPDQKIKDEWIQKALAKGKNLMLQDVPRSGLTMKDTTGGLDLAISQKKNSDNTVLLTLDQVAFGDGEINPGDIIIRNIDRGKLTPNQTRELVKEKYYKIGHSGIKVESNQYQDSMVRDLGDSVIPVTGHHTGGEKNDPEVGIYSLANLMEQGKVVLPFFSGDAHTITEVSRLVNEMRAWPDGHTGDTLMAFWFAFLEMRDHKGRSFTAPRPETQVQEQKRLTKTREELELEADLEAIRLSAIDRGGPSYRAPRSDDEQPIIKKYSF